MNDYNPIFPAQYSVYAMKKTSGRFLPLAIFELPFRSLSLNSSMLPCFTVLYINECLGWLDSEEKQHVVATLQQMDGARELEYHRMFFFIVKIKERIFFSRCKVPNQFLLIQFFRRCCVANKLNVLFREFDFNKSHIKTQRSMSFTCVDGCSRSRSRCCCWRYHASVLATANQFRLFFHI